ncbi:MULTISPECIES: phosphotransferase enzyme family protein [unclassified Mucilaginibacter]|uniref:phosphotransferase enzyme family protein n=1 Tax=unclassified Mucilaginibacter TaxID=2617802 RepID=UPI00096796B6|nr:MULTISPECIES: aminoglycoside phosphotransferase family protein [unclassified Mucilaginibacter]OJW15187.1 MAG: desulfatase [Mucilaginibacter sp. 44-25]PLW88240.1 MAG: desulfatase [Mucilaginibacter sp.]PMP66453.1 MAG: desulfatase [Mucilaginibacter sp.]HEK19344.1 aminoglycoside phosphotransferase family protein [Bacteroidota bacterium]
MPRKPENIAEVVSNFKCNADSSWFKTFGSGHINDTFLLKSLSVGGPHYLLQRINHHIFTRVDQLMHNMHRVITHLKQKVGAAGGNPVTEALTLIPTHTNQYYYQDSTGSYWRMLYFLDGARSYDIVTTSGQAFEGGRAFGKFQAMLADLPANELFEVIPDFHNARHRLSQLNHAIAKGTPERLKQVSPELELVRHYATEMQYFQQPGQVAALPQRVIHNDTKFNNVLLNSRDEAQCVIDLETVMPGYVAYDFGDAIRTIINKAAEDEADLENIQLNMPLFEAYTKGYLKEAAGFLTEAEVLSLTKGVLLLPFLQSVRFLTDHINGDIYYKIHFEGHNLQRARAQFRLFQLLHGNADMLHQIILNEYTKCKGLLR